MPRGRPAAGSVNKSEEIRNYFEKNPSATGKDCILALAKKDIEVSLPLVTGVRNRALGKTSSKKKGEVTVQEIKTLKSFVTKSNLDSAVAVNILKEFVDVIEEIGNIARFKEVLDAFDTIQDDDSESEDSEMEMEHDEDEVPVAVGGDDDEEDYEDEDEDEDDE